MKQCCCCAWEAHCSPPHPCLLYAQLWEGPICCQVEGHYVSTINTTRSAELFVADPVQGKGLYCKHGKITHSPLIHPQSQSRSKRENHSEKLHLR